MTVVGIESELVQLPVFSSCLAWPSILFKMNNSKRGDVLWN